VAGLLTVSAGDAEAARKKRGGYAPPYASIVIDVNSGRMLQGTNPDALRHPASITKVMTLYMLFEQMERGRFRLDTPLRVSAEAARKPPSKIGFDVGETIDVEDAIKALVTKSANDVAAVVAEAIAGDEDTFATLMTRKARALGMRSTTFKNASGLPDAEQVTTARDLTILGRAMHDRFPKYWRFFQTRNFEYAGRVYRNHNRLLGRVEGVDGIKTGFTRASGFNLLTSARTHNRHVMAVVLGGRSGRIRDAQMAGLVEDHMPRAFAGARTAPMIAEARTEDAPVRVAESQPAERPQPRAEVAQAPVRETPARAAEAPRPAPAAPVQVAQAETRNAEPRVVETRTRVTVPIPPVRVADLQPAAQPARAAAPVAAFAPQQATQQGPQMRWTTGAQPVRTGATPPTPPRAVPPANPRNAAVAAAAPETTASITPRSTAAAQVQRSGWVIQLGATDDETKARQILDSARTRNKAVLAEAEPFTEKVQKGSQTLFRARFAGFDGSEAQSACNSLKRSGFNCFAQRI
jgi:D-alanyl-D-alanine carboxypeptidase